VLFTVAPDAGQSCTERWCERQVPTELAPLCSVVHRCIRGFHTGCWPCTVHASGEVVTSAASQTSACTGHWSVWWRAVERVRCVKTGSGPLLDHIKHWAQASDASGDYWNDHLSLNEQGHMATIGAPDAAGCVRCMSVRASGAPVISPTALFEGVPLYICVGRLWALFLVTLTYLWASWVEPTPSHFSPLISLHSITILEWDWVIQVHWSLLCI
jgi:hypothetical protein